MCQEEFSTIDMVGETRISDEALIRKDLTRRNAVMQKLCGVVREGWPSTKDQLPLNLRPYLSIRDEITVQDDLFLKAITLSFLMSCAP